MRLHECVIRRETLNTLGFFLAASGMKNPNLKLLNTHCSNLSECACSQINQIPPRHLLWLIIRALALCSPLFHAVKWFKKTKKRNKKNKWMKVFFLLLLLLSLHARPNSGDHRVLLLWRPPQLPAPKKSVFLKLPSRRRLLSQRLEPNGAHKVCMCVCVLNCDL